MTAYVVGVDIGTSSSKGVLVDLDGHVVRSATRDHAVERPQPGHVEMDSAVWWAELVGICHELLSGDTGAVAEQVVSVGVSGMGPCVLVTDASMTPLRNAFLYGVDMRATAEIERIGAALGRDEILRRCGSALPTQAVGPKLAWLNDHEPEVFDRACHLLMPSSWLVWNLTGAYVLDHHSASQCTPLYDTDALAWYEPWAQEIAPRLELPPLLWAGDVAGTVTEAAAAATGLPVGIPVIAGTIDAWSEAVSADAHNVGDLMLMYGTTMFLVNTVVERITSPDLWVIAGLTVTHTRGDLYRAALEATAMGVRHNIEAFVAAGGTIDRVVAVGGGAQGDLWTQIVTDVTGHEQVVPEQTVGASYGAAFLAARAHAPVSITDWNPVREKRVPDQDRHATYTELYRLYVDLYPSTRDIVHALAEGTSDDHVHLS